MKPDVPAVLMELAGLVAANAMPDVHPADRAGALGLSAALLALASQAWDGAAQNLVTENRAIRELLARGAAFAPEAAALADGSDDDLRVSALDAGNARLRAALITLQIAVEGRGTAEAAALDDALWAELIASTERRLVPGSPA
jgi:hypothetical protein